MLPECKERNRRNYFWRAPRTNIYVLVLGGSLFPVDPSRLLRLSPFHLLPFTSPLITPAINQYLHSFTRAAMPLSLASFICTVLFKVYVRFYSSPFLVLGTHKVCVPKVIRRQAGLVCKEQLKQWCHWPILHVLSVTSVMFIRYRNSGFSISI